MATFPEYEGFDAVGLAGLVRSGEVAGSEVLEAAIERVEALNPAVNAVVLRMYDQARAAVQGRRPDGALAGVPYLLKDLGVLAAGTVTSWGSAFFRDAVADHDSEIVARMRRAGLVIFGKTNTSEFGLSTSVEPRLFGPTRNPWDLDRIPGGSGGGSAAAVAAFEAPLAIGTDTGGSIRQPAAVTGTVGVKPTYGGSSRYGLVALASSLDQPGPCARTVLDAALLHQVIAGHDPCDSTSIDQPVPDVVAAARSADIAGMKVGVVREFRGEGYAPGVEQRFREAVELLASLGAEIIEVSCPHFVYALPAYYLILPAECSSNLAKFDAMRFGLRVGDDGVASAEQVMAATREAGFGAEVKRRIIIGTYALSSGYYEAYYGQAQKVRTLISRDFDNAYSQVDVLVSPSTPITAFKIGEKVDDPLAMYMNDLCTIPSNLAGNASASFPVGLAPEDGLPVGLQVMAPPLADDRLYRVGAALEASLESAWGGPLLDRLPEPGVAR